MDTIYPLDFRTLDAADILRAGWTLRVTKDQYGMVVTVSTLRGAVRVDRVADVVVAMDCALTAAAGLSAGMRGEA
jgi:hypothetical protein